MSTQPQSSRNSTIFFITAIAAVFAYEFFVLEPAEKRKAATAHAAAEQQAAMGKLGLGPNGQPAPVFVPRDQAEGLSPRVKIDTPALTGSLALKGAAIDDLYLKNYHLTVDPHSPLVELFRPQGAQGAYFATLGWTGANISSLPGPDTLWTAPAGAVLSPSHPVTLTYDNGQGLTFARTLSVDDNYLFTVADQVTNKGAQTVALAPYGSVQRQCVADAQHKDPCLADGAIRSGVVQEGYIGWLGDQLRLKKYRDWAKADAVNIASTGGWLGITDKYWMASLIPDQRQSVQGTFRVTPNSAADVFEADFVAPAQAIAPGATVTQTTRLYAGAKTVPLLTTYQKALGVPQLDQAVDWGMFWFLTRPLFAIVEFFYQHVGNFGLAIVMLTVCVRLAFFPLANKSYESMTKMKKIQPQMEAIKKRNEKDPAKQQQEMMALYQQEKINPFLGCVPMLLQIPVFFSLYKVLSVTIEMRHAPFFGWVHDLSARDPSSIVNLFGALPFHPAAVAMIGGVLDGPLHIGVWPLIYLVTMWLSMSMSPQTGMDPTQQKIMQFMPLLFTFSISQVAVGVVIYWSWSNVITITQQYVIMRRFKVDNPIDQIVRRLTGKAKAA
jgi:YidC/Oxa1 family membrane protein insertase